MWSKFNQFELGTNFYAWAAQIARNKILKYREKQKRRGFQFSSEVIAEILARNQSMLSDMDDRLKALEYCVAKLNKQDRDLINLKYKKNMTIKNVAQETKRPVHGMYKTMARIHNLLKQCINKTLVEWRTV